MRKIFFLCTMMLMMVSSIQAQQVSVSEAMSRAKAFIQTNGRHRAPSQSGQTSSAQLDLAYTGNSTTGDKVCFYIFNQGTNGFIIVGGDETAQQILGYSDKGSFDYDKAPDNFKWWLSQYQAQISSAMDYAEKNPEAVAIAKSKGARKSSAKASVGPLISTQWDQTSPYSDAINSAFYNQTSYNVSLVTGCVATAMSQVMYYHHIHDNVSTGTGSKTGTTRSYAISNDTVSFTPAATFGDYDWDNMLTTYTTGNYNEEQGSAIAKLMYHAGVSVDMEYGQSSSASASQIPYAFATYFGYDKSIRHESRIYYSDSNWEEMIYKELSTNGPVIYAGQDKNSRNGHCFICDGYNSEDDTYHINWGWSGYCDCYCSLSGTITLKPGGSGSGGAGENAEYSDSQEAITNVKAASTNLETPAIYNYLGRLILLDGSTEKTEYSHTHGSSSKTLTLEENLWNKSRFLTTFTIGVKATDTTTGYEYYFNNTSTCSLLTNQYSNRQISFDVNELPYNGTYEINMIARNTNSSDWYDVGVDPSIIKPTITITGASEPTKSDVDLSISNNTVQVSRTIQISHTASYKGAISYESSDPDIATVDDNGIVTGVKTGNVTITATAAGNTYFNETTVTFPIKVTEFIKEEATATIDATQLVIGQSTQISITEGYDGTTSYSTSPDGIVSVSSNGVVTALATGTTTITVTIPETSNYKMNTLTFDVTVSEAGLIFSKAPYFSNDNNPWENDVVLHMPLYNGSESTESYSYKAKISFSDIILVYTCTINNFSKGSNYDYALNLNGNLSYFKQGIDTPLTIYFYLDDNCTIPFNIPSITYTYRATDNVKYTISSLGIGTLILPFNADIPTKDDSSNAITWKAWECTSMNGDALNLTEAKTLKRNTPYLITGDAGTYTFTGPKAIDNSPTLFGESLLKGTLLSDTYSFKAGDYILQNQPSKKGVAFYKFTTGNNWKASAYRAFLQLTTTQSTGNSYASIPGITNSDISGINNVSSSRKVAGIYTANGIKLQQFQPGLNIIVDEDGNSYKVFIKK